MVHVYYCYRDNFLSKYSDIRKVHEVLSEKIVLESEEFVNPERKISFLIGRILIMQMLENFNLNKELINNLKHNEFGRVFINNKIDFNLSHSDDIVVCAAVKNNRIGIDIEKKKVNGELRELTDCFSTAEQNEISLASLPPEKLLDLWTKKESLAKAVGMGLSLEFSDIIIQNKIGFLKNSNQKWHFYPVNIDGSFVCHLCAQKKIKGLVTKEFFI